jgi:DNA-binding winged helix-turn-helix (wHTH) protein
LRYCFEEFALDPDRRELHRGTDMVSIAPQVFDLLDYLIRNRERVVMGSRSEVGNCGRTAVAPAGNSYRRERL